MAVGSGAPPEYSANAEAVQLADVHLRVMRDVVAPLAGDLMQISPPDRGLQLVMLPRHRQHDSRSSLCSPHRELALGCYSLTYSTEMRLPFVWRRPTPNGKNAGEYEHATTAHRPDTSISVTTCGIPMMRCYDDDESCSLFGRCLQIVRWSATGLDGRIGVATRIQTKRVKGYFQRGTRWNAGGPQD